MKKTIITLIIGILVGLVGLFVINSSDWLNISANHESKSELVREQLSEIQELTTLKYEYSNVIISRTDKSLSVLGSDFSFAEAIKLISYSGYLKAGTDLSKLDVKVDSDERVVVTLDQSIITDNVVEVDKTRVEDITGELFSDYPSQLIFDEINKEREKIEIDKIEAGILEEADQQAKEMITNLLRASGYQTVEVKFR